MQILNLSEFSEAEQAAIAQIQAMYEMIDPEFGLAASGMIIVQDDAAVDALVDGIEADAAMFMADLLAAIEDQISYQPVLDSFVPVEDSPALVATMDALFAEHDPLHFAFNGIESESHEP